MMAERIGAGDDAAEEQSALSICPHDAQENSAVMVAAGAEKGSQRCEQRGEQRRKREMRLDDSAKIAPQ